MAARLTIIVSQTAKSDQLAPDFEEDLVAALLMSVGLDATLIGPLESITADGTDYLCMSGFNHNLVIVSPLETADVANHWQRLGLSGTVRQIGDSAQEQGRGGRTVYHVPVSGTSTVSEIQQTLDLLLQDRRTSTVTIDVPPQRPERKTSTANAPTGHRNEPPPSSSNAAKPTSEPVAPPTTSSISDEQEWLELDKLVDEFDSLDL